MSNDPFDPFGKSNLPNPINNPLENQNINSAPNYNFITTNIGTPSYGQDYGWRGFEFPNETSGFLDTEIRRNFTAAVLPSPNIAPLQRGIIKFDNDPIIQTQLDSSEFYTRSPKMQLDEVNFLPEKALQEEKPAKKITLRDWWHDILRDHGKYDCYAILLSLSSDVEANAYLQEFGRESDQMTGFNCLFMALTNQEVISKNFDDNAWSAAVGDQIKYGLGIQIADLFEVKFEQMPCLLLFEDIRNSSHALIDLQDLEAADVAKKMRFIFGVVKDSVEKNKKTITQIEKTLTQKKREDVEKKITGQVKELTKKTFEVALETIMRAAISAAS